MHELRVGVKIIASCRNESFFKDLSIDHSHWQNPSSTLHDRWHSEEGDADVGDDIDIIDPCKRRFLMIIYFPRSLSFVVYYWRKKEDLKNLLMLAGFVGTNWRTSGQGQDKGLKALNRAMTRI